MKQEQTLCRNICISLLILWMACFAWIAMAQESDSKPVYGDRCPYTVGETVTVPERLELDENGDTLFYFEEYTFVWTLDDSLQCAASYRRDSLRWADRDTSAANIPNVNIIGDVISGYNFTAEPAWVGDPYIERIDTITTINGSPLQTPIYDTITAKNNHPNAFRWYHTDPHGNKVRQIVVTTLRWDNLPEDLMVFEEESPNGEKLSDLCGQRLAALTPKEYKEYRKLGLIWGEVFEVCYAEGTHNLPDEERIKVIGMEIVCLRDSAQGYRIPPYNIGLRYNSREIMTYTDPSTGKDFLCAAPNRYNGKCEYTLEASNGRYETRWTLASDEESDRWWKKYLDWLQNTTAYRYIRSLWISI